MGGRRRLSAAVMPLTPSRAENIRSEGTPVMKKAVSKTPASGHKDRKLTPAKKKVVRRMSPDQLLNLYSEAVKLSAENKITTKNTWNLHLIEHFDDVLASTSNEAEETQQHTNFTVASAALEAGMKIYSSRVDAVHTDMYKVLGNFTRTGMSADNEEDDEAAEARENKKMRAKKAFVETLEQNMENINMKKMDTAHAADPLFHKTSAAFDEGGAKGMLLNGLCVDRDCAIVFASGGRGGSEESKAKTTHVDVSGLKEVMAASLEVMKTASLCPQFSSFVSDAREQVRTTLLMRKAALAHSSSSSNSKSESRRESVDEEGSTAGMMSPSGSMVKAAASQQHVLASKSPWAAELSHAATPASSLAGLLNEHASSAGAEVAQFDDLMAGGFGSPGGFSDDSGLGGFDAGFEAGEDVVESSDGYDVAHLAQVLADASNEYCYFDERLLSNWAGPAHWKAIAPAKAKDSEGEDGSDGKKKRAKKEPFFLDLFSDPIDTKKAFATSRASTLISAAMRKKAEDEVITLPVDHHYEPRRLMQLFHKPRKVVTLQQRAGPGVNMAFADMDDMGFGAGGDDDDDSLIGGDDFGGVDDAMFGDMMGEEGMIPGVGSSSAMQQQQEMGDFNLIEQPTRVQKLDIKYDRTSKMLDVKRLKESIWGDLCETRTPDDATRVPEEKTFTEVIEQLPGYAPQSMMPAVSVPFCFICLLHLANENTLQITDQSDMNELHILQE